MRAIPFCKFHGFGNDYIVIERSSLDESASLSDLAMSICHRHTGAGADGIAVLSRLDGNDADLFCEIVNPDGSIAGFSGNGTRCAVAYLYFKRLWREPSVSLGTRSGVKRYSLIEEVADGHYWFEAEIGRPRFRSDEVPVATGTLMETVVGLQLRVGETTTEVACVNVGNPVACIFVREFDRHWRELGRELEVHPVFPERANIVFVKVHDRENIELRIWERGAGETTASGTCASAAAVLSAVTGRTSRSVSVSTEGGTTEVYWRADDEILLTGRADLAYCGEWLV